MHEFAIAHSLVEAATTEARRAGAHRVTCLRCRIGVMRQVEEALLSEAFALARAGGICEEAELDVEKVPMRAQCPKCDAEYAVRDWVWTCPSCGAEAVGISGGDELELVSIDVEVHDEHPSSQERV